jgi:hypothetical protein
VLPTYPCLAIGTSTLPSLIHNPQQLDFDFSYNMSIYRIMTLCEKNCKAIINKIIAKKFFQVQKVDDQLYPLET